MFEMDDKSSLDYGLTNFLTHVCFYKELKCCENITLRRNDR